MQPVELVAGHPVDVRDDRFLVEIGARNVEHDAPVGKARRVFDQIARNLDRLDPPRGGRVVHRGGQQLEKRLKRVEGAGIVAALDPDLRDRDVERIALGR